LSLLVIGSSGDFLGGLADPLTGIPSRFVIERNVDLTSIPDFGFLPFIPDFTGPASFDPEVIPASVTGLNNEPNIVQSTALTDCRQNFLSLAELRGTPVGGAFSVYGVPATKRKEGERHFVSISASDGAIVRMHGRVFDPTVTPSLALPPVLEPELQQLAAPYVRLRFSYPRTFARSGQLIQYLVANGQSFSHIVAITATPRYQGGQQVSLSVPDLSSLPGWDNAWAPPLGSAIIFAVQDRSESRLFAVRELCAEQKQSARVGTWPAPIVPNPAIARSLVAEVGSR
jgi:hypothetical protein